MIDMLHSVSAASNAASAKFQSCFFPSMCNQSLDPKNDYDINADYSEDDSEIPSFPLAESKWKRMV
jgi:hypothetical protein